MKLIVTKQNDDGSFDDVGINNRALFSKYLTVKMLLNLELNLLQMVKLFAWKFGLVVTSTRLATGFCILMHKATEFILFNQEI